MDIVKYKEHLGTAMESVDTFVTTTSELPYSILLSSVAMILEKVSGKRRLDVIEVAKELQWAVEAVNKEHGKYEGE